MPAEAEAVDTPLRWHREDPECRWGLRGGRYTRVNILFTGILAAILSAVFLGGLLALPDRWAGYADIILRRGPTQYATVFLAAWSLLFLWIKWRKLRVQRAALNYSVTPDRPDFVLSPLTADEVVHRIYALADEPQAYILYNRILLALSNLRNLGRVTDVDDILRSIAGQDESALETSYSLVQGFVWAIPVLGFIGTVLGLSQSIAAFSQVLAGGGDVNSLTNGLRHVTAGLATAFDTTLVALVAALVIQMIITSLRKAEYEFLESCSEYCSRHIVGRLRLTMEESREPEHA
ncbi:MAG: MotA/TolQ/ExbB proton channel family protein [Thermogutta sp.]|nr:MotA/TolQ/ExbB proton channel family protein [Thermogutta sp.]